MGHKLKFVLSDLHLGVDHLDASQQLGRDFSAGSELIDFLYAIWRESELKQQEVELIINGDLFAFLQVPAVDAYDPAIAYPREVYLDSSQEASIKRLDLIVDANQALFQVFSRFLHAEAPQRRLTIIKGNHDVNIFWPGVKNRLRELLDASGVRASLLRFADEFVSRENIYIEHGHQRAEKMNSYHDSFDPRTGGNPQQLHYPAGTRFTIDFLNEAKRQRRFVDHIKPVTALIWYAFHWNFDFACAALASFIRHTPALVLNDLSLGDGLSSARHTLLQELESEESRGQLARRYATDFAFRQKFHRQVQEYLDDAMIDTKGETILPLIEVSDDPIMMGRAIQRRQREILHRAAQQIAEQEGARVIIFGHTHRQAEETLSNGSIYINTGCWIEDFSDAPPATWKALFEGTLPPNRKLHNLPYARIDYDHNNFPTARLLYFKETVDRETQPMPSLPANLSPDSPGFLRKHFPWLSDVL